MQSFEGRIAVVTGGGSGMGRELVRQLAEAGCNVAMCDVSEEGMAQTRALCASRGAAVQVSGFLADVSDERQVTAFRDAVAEAHATDHIDSCSTTVLIIRTFRIKHDELSRSEARRGQGYWIFWPQSRFTASTRSAVPVSG